MWSFPFLLMTLLAFAQCQYQFNEHSEMIYSKPFVFDYRNETLFYLKKRSIIGSEVIFPTILNTGLKNYINSLWIDDTKSDTYFTSSDNCIYIILNGTARKFAGNGFPGI